MPGEQRRTASERNLRKLLRALPRRCRVWIGGAGAPALDVGDDPVEVITSFGALASLGR